MQSSTNLKVEKNQLGPALPFVNNDNGTAHLHAIAGSLVQDYHGDAMVNAANTGCVTGFGIDGATNRAGGYALLEARKQLHGCPTGESKITQSFGLQDQVQYIIHAVGPVYRSQQRTRHLELNLLFGQGDNDKQEKEQKKDNNDEAEGGDAKKSAAEHENDDDNEWAEHDVLLRSAYHTALQRAAEVNCETIGFCLLSAGVFRGDRPLADVVEMAVDCLLSAPQPLVARLTSVCLYAFTEEEQECLQEIMTRKGMEEERQHGVASEPVQNQLNRLEDDRGEDEN